MEVVINKLPRGSQRRKNQMEQLKRWADYVCVHFICLPPFLPADFKERPGRTHKRNVKETEISSFKISLEISERDERRGLTSIQNLWKSHKASSSSKMSTTILFSSN
jgi:hypothetical protein